MAIGHQSFYQTALTSAINSTDLIIPLDTVPTVSEGFLVIESTVEAKREIIYYTSKDATTVTCPSGAGNGRGYDGTTAVSHTQGAAVIMAPVGVMFEKFGTVSLGGINDTNGNELLKVTATASAVNELTLANAATGNAPVLSATGGDTNVDITLTPKGTGVVNLTKWSNPYKFLVYRNAAYNQPVAATVFPFDTEVFDTNNNFDVTTNVGRYTAPVTGYYHFTVQTIIACTSGDHIIPELYVDGSLYTRLGEQSATATTNLTFGGTAMVYMTAGQYIEAKYAISTLRGCLVGNKAYCWFTGHLISMT